MTRGQKGQEEFDEHAVEKPQSLAGWWPLDKGNKSQERRAARSLHKKTNNMGQEDRYKRTQDLQHICYVDLTWGKSGNEAETVQASKSSTLSLFGLSDTPSHLHYPEAFCSPIFLCAQWEIRSGVSHLNANINESVWMWLFNFESESLISVKGMPIATGRLRKN